MSPEHEDSLVSKYPSLFAKVFQHPDKNTLMFFGCECGDGWFSIIDNACGLISGYTKQREKDFSWFQIKEKFGSLRMYPAGGYDGYIAGVIAMAESMSRITCEQCGQRGESRGKGWITTLCDSCLEGRT
jgi:hypothetical protein